MIKQKYMTHRKFRLQVRIFGFSFSVFGQTHIHHNNFKQNYKSKSKKKILTNFWNQSQKNYHWIQPIKGDHTSLTSTIKSYNIYLIYMFKNNCIYYKWPLMPYHPCLHSPHFGNHRPTSITSDLFLLVSLNLSSGG